MVEVNFTVELGLPVERSTVRLGFLCCVECVAQQARPRDDLDVYVILLEGMGNDRREHRVPIQPRGNHRQAHRILDTMEQAIWDEAYSEDVATRLGEKWAEITAEERAMARRFPRRSESAYFPEGT